jgi:hypothetical protein
MSRQAELYAEVFAGVEQAGALPTMLLAWMEASTRFTGFVETYRDKIRKKIRVTRDAESLLDVQAELAAAYGLLSDRRFTLTYEPYASARRRGPDFALTYRTNQVINLEVARIRAEEGDGALNLAKKEERLLRILLDKLGQMQPGMPNLLAVHTPAPVAQALDLAGLVQGIKRRAEARDAAFYALSRYSGPADFYQRFLRLSGILLWGQAPVQVWVNKTARPALEEKVIRVVAACLDVTQMDQRP